MNWKNILGYSLISIWVLAFYIWTCKEIGTKEATKTWVLGICAAFIIVFGVYLIGYEAIKEVFR